MSEADERRSYSDDLSLSEAAATEAVASEPLYTGS
jgi:hypothetical protein